MILLNGIEIKPTIFPDKTSQVWRIEVLNLDTEGNEVEWRFENEAEFMHLAQLKALLDELGAGASLLMPYLPYARQDKAIANNRTFALHAFAGLLNTLGFEEVRVTDPHSEIPAQLIRRFRPSYPTAKIWDVRAAVNADIFCYPDAGARAKYTHFFDMNLPTLHATKIRDQGTGEILGLVVNGDPPKDKVVLIVDDICDGGATFVHLAQKLYELGASEVHLFVSHGLFTKGTQVLRDAGIKRIFTKEGEVK